MNKFKKIYLEITNVCNLNCDFCIKNTRKNEFLSKQNFKKILLKIKQHTDYLYFHILGEPLMHPFINEFIDIASKNFKVNITTNGYLIDKIKDNKNIRQLNISLHSFSSKNKKTIDEYMDNILKTSSILASNGTYISFRFWANNKYSKEILNKINAYFNTNIKLENISNNITVKENIFISISKEFIWPNLDNKYNSEKGKCYALKDHIGILVDGTVVPCCLDTKGDINLGNIYEDSIQDIMNKPRVQNLLEGFKKSAKIEQLCRKCHFLSVKNIK